MHQLVLFTIIFIGFMDAISPDFIYLRDKSCRRQKTSTTEQPDQVDVLQMKHDDVDIDYVALQ